MYKLLFIDEEKDTLDDFQNYVEKFNSKVKLSSLVQLPLQTIDDMIESIIKISPDALIVDHRLNEMKTDIKYNVEYNGTDLVEEFQKIRNNFPCFILTAVDDEAVNQSDDVNIVYIKQVIYSGSEEKAKAKFLDKVIRQIEHYKSKIENAEKELRSLLLKRKFNNVDIEIENRIIELDDFLEKSINANLSIPSEYKTLSNSNRLDSIINKVDELLKKLDDDKL